MPEKQPPTSRLVAVIDNASETLGRAAAWLSFMLVLVVGVIVVLRYGFQLGSIALQESVMYINGALFVLGAGYTLKAQGHVRVDVFYDNFSPRVKAYINLFGALFFVLPVTLLILYYSWDYTLEAYEMGEGSADPGGLPHRFIIRGVIPVSSVFLIVCVLYVVLEQLQRLTGNTPSSTDHKDAI